MMMNCSDLVSQQWPSNDKIFFAALSLAGAVDEQAFLDAHDHIISTVETPPPQNQLYPDWLPLSRRRQPQCTYPLWYKSYKNVCDTFIAVLKSRNDLEDILTKADERIEEAYANGKPPGIRKRELVLYLYDIEGPSSECWFRRLQYAFIDKKDEIEECYRIHQLALLDFNSFLQIPDDSYLQIVSFLSPNFQLKSMMSSPTDLSEKFDLQLETEGWCLTDHLLQKHVELLEERYIWVDKQKLRLDRILENPHIDGRIQWREIIRFYSHHKTHSNVLSSRNSKQDRGGVEATELKTACSHVGTPERSRQRETMLMQIPGIRDVSPPSPLNRRSERTLGRGESSRRPSPLFRRTARASRIVTSNFTSPDPSTGQAAPGTDMSSKCKRLRYPSRWGDDWDDDEDDGPTLVTQIK